MWKYWVLAWVWVGEEFPQVFSFLIIFRDRCWKPLSRTDFPCTAAGRRSLWHENKHEAHCVNIASVFSSSSRMIVLTSRLPGDAASGRNIEAGVTQQVLVVGLESVEVVVVFSLASLPPEADLIIACFSLLSLSTSSWHWPPQPPGGWRGGGSPCSCPGGRASPRR